MSGDMINPVTHVCPGCKGKKTVFAHLNYGGARPNEWKHIECDGCKGKGYIFEDERLAIEAGKKLREERQSRGLSLREEALRLGIKATTLSSMERGRITAKGEAKP